MTKRITQKVVQLSIIYGYYVGGIPFYWNSHSRQIHLVQSCVDTARWILATVVSTCTSALIICGTVLGLLNSGTCRNNATTTMCTSASGFQNVTITNKILIGPTTLLIATNHDVQKLVHVLVLVGCVASSLLHLNLVLKRKEIVCTMNRCLKLMNQLENLKAQPIPWNNAEMILILTVAFFFSICFPCISMSMYWTSSDFHIWFTTTGTSVGGRFLVNTSNNTSMEANRIALSIIASIIQFAVQWYFLTITCSVALLYLVLTYPVLYFGSEHFKMLLSETTHHNHRLALHTFIRNYRSFQLLIACEDSCFGSFTLPGHLIILSTACIVSLNALIKISMAFAQYSFFLAIISGYVLHLLTGVKEASLLPQLTKLFFSSYQSNRKYRNFIDEGGASSSSSSVSSSSSYSGSRSTGNNNNGNGFSSSLLMRRYMNSFPPLSVGFGSFGRLDKNMYTWILSTCISFTVSILLIK